MSRCVAAEDTPEVDTLLSSLFRDLRGQEPSELTDAVAALESQGIIEDVDMTARHLMKTANKKDCGELPAKNAAFVMLYTCENETRPPVYKEMNSRCYKSDRTVLQHFLQYQWGLMWSLAIITPPDLKFLWRGLAGIDLVDEKNPQSKKYQKDCTVTWWGCTSCTTEMKLLAETNQFFGVSKPRTLFHILLKTKTRARNITPFNVCKEVEVVFPFGSTFKVTGSSYMVPGEVALIELEEVEEEDEGLTKIWQQCQAAAVGGAAVQAKQGYSQAAPAAPPVPAAVPSEASPASSWEAPAAAQQVTAERLQEMEREADELHCLLKESASALGETSEDVPALLKFRDKLLDKVQKLLDQSDDESLANVKKKNSLRKLKKRISSIQDYIIFRDEVLPRSEAEAKMRAREEEEEKEKIQKAAATSSAATAAPAQGTLAGPSQASPALQQAIQKALAALAAKNVLAVAAALGEAVGFGLSDAPELNNAKAFLLAEQAREISTNCRMPMHEAAYQGDTDAVRGLILAKCNQDARDIGHIPLHLAALNNRVEIVTLLLEAKADKDARTHTGETPLHYAAANDCVESIKLLLDARADKGATTGAGFTPFQEALFRKSWAARRLLGALNA